MDNLIIPEDLIQEAEDIEEYYLRVRLTNKDYNMLRQYAERMKCTEEALIQIFINDLVKGRFCTNNEVAKKANKWYEDVSFMRRLESQLVKKSVKIVRFKDGGLLTTHGTKEQVINQMEKKFPGRKIAAIT